MKKVIAISGILLMTTILAAEIGKMVWNFDADKINNPASDFSNEAGEWKVVSDTAAPSIPNVLAQQAKSPGSIFNLTLIKDTHYKDVDISVKMKAIAGEVDQGGGAVWRAKDANNYYIARYNPLEENYRVYKVLGGKRIQLQSSQIKYTEGWHELRVTMIGNRIECYYDTKRYLSVEDSTLQEAGKIGLWTKADAQSYFDDLTVVW